MYNFNSTEAEKVEAEKVEAEKVETEKVETEESGARVPLFDEKELFCTVLVIVMALGLGVGVILSNWIIGLTAGVLVGIIAGTITLFFRKK